SGVLVVSGACQVLIGHQLNLADAMAFLVPANAIKLAAGAAVGVLLLLAVRRSSSAAVVPGILLFSAVLAYIVMLATHTSLADAQTTGWMFKVPAKKMCSIYRGMPI